MGSLRITDKVSEKLQINEGRNLCIFFLFYDVSLPIPIVKSTFVPFRQNPHLYDIIFWSKENILTFFVRIMKIEEIFPQTEYEIIRNSSELLS